MAFGAMAWLLGCDNGSPRPRFVDPFDCEVISPSGFPQEGLPLDGDIQLDFTDHQFGHGTAPTRMKGMVLELAIDHFRMAACGRDAQNREWQITASWMALPVPVAEPLEFPAAPRWTGTLGSEVRLPGFGATLEYCGPSCAQLEWRAFDGPYFPNSNVEGTARVDAFDYCGGKFTGSAQLAHSDGARRSQGPMLLSAGGTWAPAPEVSDGKVNPQTGQPGTVGCN
jgi:hypothetical protein